MPEHSNCRMGARELHAAALLHYEAALLLARGQECDRVQEGVVLNGLGVTLEAESSRKRRDRRSKRAPRSTGRLASGSSKPTAHAGLDTSHVRSAASIAPQSPSSGL